MTYKSYVRNKAYPEGSIVEAYIVNESLTFCSQYLLGIETKFNRPNRNVDYLNDQSNEFSIFFLKKLTNLEVTSNLSSLVQK